MSVYILPEVICTHAHTATMSVPRSGKLSNALLSVAAPNGMYPATPTIDISTIDANTET